MPGPGGPHAEHGQVANGARDEILPEVAGPAGGRSRSDVVFGAVGAAAILLALYYLVVYTFGGGPRDGAVAGAPVPLVRVVSPSRGEVVDQPVAVVFETDARLVRDATGWSADRRHLHVLIGSTEVMAAPADVRELGGGRYRWTLPRVAPGEYPVRILWSDENHQPIRAGGSSPHRILFR